jgi:nucleotide-binding universal stress UspA family protein
MKLLFGLATGADSLEALERSASRARAVGDELVVAVLEGPDEDGELEATADRARGAVGDEIPVRTIEGHPGSRLVEIAESEGFDRILLGGGEQSPMGKIRIDSIAEFVLLNSHVSVTLLR